MEIISFCYYLYLWQRFNWYYSNNIQKFSKFSIKILITHVKEIIEILDELKWYAIKNFKEFIFWILYSLFFEQKYMRKRNDCLNIDNEWYFRNERIKRNMNFRIKYIYNNIYSKINYHFISNLIQVEFHENKIIIDISIENWFNIHLIIYFHWMSINNNLNDD